MAQWLKRSLLLRALMVVAVAIVSFLAGMRNVPVWDDVTILQQRLAPTGNTGLASLWTTPYWGTFGPADTYRPLGLSIIYLERQAFGADPLGYHLVSLALHALACLAAWWTMSRLLGRSLGWVSALLFAAHPIHAEAVGMVYGQLELLAALFGLLAIALFDGATSPRAFALDARYRPLAYAGSLLCAALAVCSKESAVMVPVLMLIVYVYRRWDDTSAAPATIARGLLPTAAFFVTAGAFMVARQSVLGTFTSDTEATVAMDYPLPVRFNLLVVSAGEALRLCVVPTGQTVYYGHLRDALFGWPVMQSAFVLAAVYGLIFLKDHLRGRVIALALAWLLLTFFPVSNIIPSGVVVAERTLYLPVLGVCVLIAATLSALLKPRVAIGVLAALVLVGVVQSNRVVYSWRDDLTLWRTTVAAHPRSPQSQLLLGKALLRKWDEHPNEPIAPAELEEASDAFSTAWELNPSWSEALTGSGWVALRRGDRQTAEEFFSKALDRSPDDPSATAGLKLARPDVRRR
ncbi:MAG: hypothetical protein QM770_17435 [Tepidisphaeraceae bacterium]